jgi:hypothetical protein
VRRATFLMLIGLFVAVVIAGILAWLKFPD